MNAFCPHCASNLPVVWLLQGADGRLAVLADGDVFALAITRTAGEALRPLAGFDADARTLAHGPRLEVSERIRVEDELGWPAGMWPIAVWDGGGSRLLRDVGEVDDTARAYLRPHGNALVTGNPGTQRR
jgi:hypothetical protein